MEFIAISRTAGITFVSTSQGLRNTCGISTEGLLFCWGNNAWDQLGSATEATCREGTTSEARCVAEPIRVPIDERVIQVSVGMDWACATTESGQILCWGYGRGGHLGRGSLGLGLSRAEPEPVVGSVHYTSVAVSTNFACGLSVEGSAYCWGTNRNGKLGVGDTEGRTVPTSVSGNLRFRTIALGTDHACGLTTDGAAYCWGEGNSGRLGTGEPTNRYTTPQRVQANVPFTDISLGGALSCASTESGSLYCWGSGRSGVMGADIVNTPFQSVATPTHVAPDYQFQSFSVGFDYVCGVDMDENAWCWGSNGLGQLGNGTIDESFSATTAPERVLFDGSIKQVWPALGYVMCATTSNGLHCWGDNDFGQVGDGTTLVRSRPTRVLRQP